MRRVAVIIFACLAASAFGAGTATAATLGFAVDDGFQAAAAASPNGPAGTAAALTQLNATWVRIDVRWNTIATRQPTNARLAKDPAYVWTAVDAAVASARSLVLPRQTPTAGPPQLLLSIGGTPDWARADGGAGGSPGDPAWTPKRAAFQNFVAAVVARYGSVAAAYEIWPSPNSAAGLRPQVAAGRLVAAGIYRVLLKYATVEIRKVTTAPIVTGGLARTDSANTADTPSITFLRALGRMRVQADAIGVRLQPATGVEGPADGANLALADPAAIVASVDAYFPGQTKAVWETGYGITSSVDPALQAGGVSAFLGAAQNPRFGVAIWNALIDTTGAPGYGLYSAATPLDGTTQKPAWFTWTGIIPPPA